MPDGLSAETLVGVVGAGAMGSGIAQVAAQSGRQWSVAKQTANGVTRSRVAALDDNARVEEIARMLGGMEITATTRKHAAEMLGSAAKG